MPPAKKPTPKKPTKTQRPSWMIPAAIVGVVLFLGLVVVNKIHQGAARAHAAALAAGVSPDRAAEMTSDASILSHIAGSADRKQRAAEIQAKAAAAFAQEMADVHPEKPRATADPAAPIDGLLAKGDLAGAQRLLPNTADDAMSHVRRGRFYDAAGKDKRALEELEGAVAAGGSKIVRAAALTALGNAKLRQGDHAGAKAAAEAALALNWTNNDAYRLAAEVARRDERWQDVITILDKHLHQVEDADLEMRLFEAHKALDHKGWAGEWLDAGALHAGDDPHAKIRVGLSRPYDRGLSMAADAYRAALAAGQNDLELHLLGAETAARRKDPAGLKAAVDAAAATGAKDARVWYWQGRAADARNDSELADAMYTQAKARDPHFDPVALAYLKSRR